MRTAFDVAQYMLKLSSPECGDFLSNLKLQKLLYYAQGVFLAVHDRPLFEEDLYKWEYGPVVPEVYRYYKDHGSNAIPVPVDFDGNVFTAEEQEVLDEVMVYYGQFSAWKLRDMTHQERPWLSVPKNEMIPKELVKEFFKEAMVA